MRFILCLLLLVIPIPSKAEAFGCGELKGVTMQSIDGYQVADPDGMSGVRPMVSIYDKDISISQRTRSGGIEELWRVEVIHRSSESISGAIINPGPSISSAMLVTVDVKRGYLYVSSHKDNKLQNIMYIVSLVAKCTKLSP